MVRLLVWCELFSFVLSAISILDGPEKGPDAQGAIATRKRKRGTVYDDEIETFTSMTGVINLSRTLSRPSVLTSHRTCTLTCTGIQGGHSGYLNFRLG